MIIGLKGGAWLQQTAPHPGTYIAAEYLEAVDDYPGMTVSEAARKLDVSRSHLSRVIHGRGPVTLDLALKMEAAGWSTAENWMQLQTRYDIAQARKRLGRPRAEAPAGVRVQRLQAGNAPSAKPLDRNATRSKNVTNKARSRKRLQSRDVRIGA